MTIGEITTHAVAFASGILVKYLADLFTDKRKEKEKRDERAELWQTMLVRMPELIAEMRADWSKPEHRLRRTFYTLPEGVERSIITPEKILFYTWETHPQIEDKIHILEEHGWVTLEDIDGARRKYRVSDEFVKRLVSSS